MSSHFESDDPGHSVDACSESGPTDERRAPASPAADSRADAEIRERPLEEEANFRTLVQTIDDLILVATPEGRIVFGNAAVERKLGYTAAELEPLALLDLHPPHLQSQAITHLSAILRGEQRTCPLPLRRKDGSLLPVETRAWLGQWNGQRCLFGICKDLSAEQEAQQRFERLFQRNPMPMALTTLPDQRFADVNDAWLEILGYARAEVIGRSTAELNLFPDSGRQRQASVELQEKGFIRDVELQVRTRSGTLRDGLFSGEVLQTQGRNYLLTVMVDITPRRRAEEALAAEVTRRRILVEESRDGIVVLNQDGGVYEANRRFAEMVGYSAEEVRRLRVIDWDRSWSMSEVVESIRQLGPEGAHFESRHWRKDGTSYDVELSNSVAVLGGQKLVFCVCRDITERKRAEALLRESLLFRREAEKIARIGAWKVNPINDYLHWTEGVYDIVEAPLDYRPGLKEGLQVYDAGSIPAIQSALETALRDGTPFVIEAGVTTFTGRHLWAEVRGLGRVEEHGQAFVMGTFQDITARKREETRAARESLRLRFLLELHQRAPLMTDQELYDHVLDRAVLLTDSVIGFLHLVAEDQRTLILTTWNQEARNDCTATADTHYPLNEAGNWVDCIRQQRPIVYNSYEQSPNRQGLPSGHTPVTRFMSVPVMQDGKARIIFGVGNKPTDYDDDDVTQVMVVANELHKIMVQRIAQEQLRQLSRAVEQSTVGVAISDTEGRIDYANPKFSEITGFSLEEIRGRGALGLDSAELTPETGRELWDTLHSGRNWHHEFRNRRKSGESYWQSASVSPITEPSGKISHIVMVMEDIEERKRLETFREVLLSLGRQLNLTTDAASASRALLGAADRLWQWDAAALDMIQNDRGQIYPVLSVDTIDGVRRDVPAVVNQLTTRTRRVLQKGAQLILRDDHESFGSDTVPFGDLSRPSRSIMDVPIHRDTQIVGIFSLHSYRTHAFTPEDLQVLQALADYCGGALERIRSEEAARASEDRYLQAQKLEAIGQLAGGVAHDFNNILAAMMMNLGLMRENPHLDGETVQSLDELGRATNRAASLTRQLLMFNRRSVMALKPLDLNEVIENLLKMLRRLIGEQVSLRLDATSRLPLVEADAGMLEQVLMNLVVNARDAMPRGGTITIATTVRELTERDATPHPESRPGRFVCLATSDTGSGMSAETMQRVFEPFFTTKAAGAGTGLGLATVHGIVAQHKGWVTVESTLGVGSTFKVYLPALAETAQTQARAGGTAPIRRGHETILLVEDDATLRRFATLALRAFGYRVTAVPNGREALELWQSGQDHWDLVLTDMVMPEGVNGLELVERLRAMKPGVKAIISSGYSTEISRPGVLAKANVVYLPKPYETHTLAEAVRSALDGSS